MEVGGLDHAVSRIQQRYCPGPGRSIRGLSWFPLIKELRQVAGPLKVLPRLVVLNRPMFSGWPHTPRGEGRTPASLWPCASGCNRTSACRVFASRMVVAISLCRSSNQQSAKLWYRLTY